MELIILNLVCLKFVLTTLWLRYFRFIAAIGESGGGERFFLGKHEAFPFFAKILTAFFAKTSEG